MDVKQYDLCYFSLVDTGLGHFPGHKSHCLLLLNEVKIFRHYIYVVSEGSLFNDVSCLIGIIVSLLIKFHKYTVANLSPIKSKWFSDLQKHITQPRNWVHKLVPIQHNERDPEVCFGYYLNTGICSKRYKAIVRQEWTTFYTDIQICYTAQPQWEIKFGHTLVSLGLAYAVQTSASDHKWSIIMSLFVNIFFQSE